MPCMYCGKTPCMGGCNCPSCAKPGEEPETCSVTWCHHALDRYGHCGVQVCQNSNKSCPVHAHYPPSKR